MNKFFKQDKCYTYYGKSKKNQYKSILLPPPNITGSLHMGHALSTTLQDILIRFWKIEGYDVKWQLGIDHAGIATEIMVQKYLASQNIIADKDTFIQYTNKWVEKHKNIIIDQMYKLGFDINDDFRYTMDEQYKHSVQKAFTILLKEGFIHQDKRLINYDHSIQSAISDLEITHIEKNTKLYFIKYKCEDKYINIATTRPETIFADQALAVNPKGKYQYLIGKYAIVPIIEKKIPIIGDIHAKDNIGSGIVKITPAHDFNDFKVGKRHKLELDFNILNKDGTLNNNVPKEYQNLTIEAARKKILNYLSIDKIDIIKNTIPISSRTECIVEPMISNQFFMKMDILAKKAMKHMPVFNHNWKKVYIDWLYNIEPWCISRQIKWGHIIPGSNDVLDTWFSSGLWAIETMNEEDMSKYYPFTVLITGHDIIFFWVARMCMLSLYFTKKIPFKNVLLHPIVLDEKGQKMSKTKGNVINPLDIIEQYGTDALRLSLAKLSNAIYSVRFDKTHIEGYKNLINKLWNSARCIMSLDVAWNVKLIEPESDIDKFMMTKLSILCKEYRENMDKFIYNTDLLISTFRDDFCDIYLEFAKILKPKCLGYIFASFISMFYPFIPFVTTEIANIFNTDELKIPNIRYSYHTSFDDIYILIKKIFKIKSLYGKYRAYGNLGEYTRPVEKISGIIIVEEQLDGIKITSGKYILHTDIVSNIKIIENKSDILNKMDKIISLFDNEQFLSSSSKEVQLQKLSTLKKLNDNLYEILSIINDYKLFDQYKRRIIDISTDISSR